MNDKSVEELKRMEVDFEIIVLPQAVHSVKDVQEVCGCKTAEVIKTLLFIANAPVMIILPGDRKADVAKIKILLGVTSLRMATKEEVSTLTGYTVGSVSPFGIDHSIQQVADESILKLSSLFVGSGKDDRLIKLTQIAFVKSFRRGTIASISM